MVDHEHRALVRPSEPFGTGRRENARMGGVDDSRAVTSVRSVRAALRTLIRLGVVAVLLTFAVRGVQGQLIYLGTPAPPPPPVTGAVPITEVAVRRPDGSTIPAWWATPAAPTSEGPGPAVLFLHGNAGSRAEGTRLAEALAPDGIAVLAAEYRGFGGVPGTASEGGLTQDALAAFDHLASQPEVDAARIVIVGHSLGTGVATAVAAQRPVLALVLLAPFTELADVPAQSYSWFPFDLVLTEEYDSESRVARLDVPVAVALVTEDPVVPPVLARRLHAAAKQPESLIQIRSADHADPELMAGPEVVEVIVRLTGSVPGAPR